MANLSVLGSNPSGSGFIKAGDSANPAVISNIVGYAGEDTSIAAASGQSILLNVGGLNRWSMASTGLVTHLFGDNAGANKYSMLDSDTTEVWYVDSDGTGEYAGNLTVQGDLTVNGATTTLTTTNTQVEDSLVRLNYSSGSAPAPTGGGIELQEGAGIGAQLTWNADDLWEAYSDAATTQTGFEGTQFVMPTGTAPTNLAGHGQLYTDSSGDLHFIDDAGVDTNLLAALAPSFDDIYNNSTPSSNTVTVDSNPIIWTSSTAGDPVFRFGDDSPLEFGAGSDAQVIYTEDADNSNYIGMRHVVAEDVTTSVALPTTSLAPAIFYRNIQAASTRGNVMRLDSATGAAVAAQADSVTNATVAGMLLRTTTVANEVGSMCWAGSVVEVAFQAGSGLDTASNRGKPVYLDQTNAGKLTITKPSSGVVAQMGILLHHDASAPFILFNPQEPISI